MELYVRSLENSNITPTNIEKSCMIFHAPPCSPECEYPLCILSIRKILKIQINTI